MTGRARGGEDRGERCAVFASEDRVAVAGVGLRSADEGRLEPSARGVSVLDRFDVHGSGRGVEPDEPDA